MTILFFSRLFYPHIGGIEKHSFEIARRLIKKGYKIIVVTEKFDKKLKNFEIYQGIVIYRMPIINNNWFKKFDIWMWLLTNRKLIKNADIIHCHDVFFWYLPFRFIYPKKPVFTTFHGYESYPVSRKAILIRKISELLSFGNICIGKFMKKWYYASPDYISYGGIEVIKRKAKKAKGNSAVFIGRLDEQTGILTYVKGAEIIKKKIPEFEFVIVGDGQFKKIVEKKFKVLGFKKDVQKHLFSYRFAFVSRYLSILEAMAAKRLVLAVFDNPLKEDYLKMTPFKKFIIIENSAKKIAEKVEYFLNHKNDEEKITQEAYHWAKTQSWEFLVDLYLKLWRKNL